MLRAHKSSSGILNLVWNLRFKFADENTQFKPVFTDGSNGNKLENPFKIN